MDIAVAASRIVTDSPDGLVRALSQARPGATIVLAPGNYGEMRITPTHLAQGGHGFDAPVTITSQDPDAPTVFEGLNLMGVANLTLDGLVFEHAPQAGDRVNDPVLAIRALGDANAANIAVTNSRFVGLPADAGAGGDPADPADVVDHGGLVAGMFSGIAINARDADNVTVADNEITGFFRGISVEGVSDVVLSRNDMRDIRSDGITVGEVHTIIIEGNTIRDLMPWRHDEARNRGDHPDMIQVWTTNSETASTGIVIRDNALIQSRTDGGLFAQGIFMRNPKAERDPAGTDFFYRDVTIEGNLIYSPHVNALVVGEADGVTIRDNVLIHNTDAGIRQLTTPIIAVAERATDVAITGNIVPGMARDVSVIGNMATLDAGAGLGWVVEGNTYTEVQQGADGQVAIGPDGVVVVEYDAFLSGLDVLLERARAAQDGGMAEAIDAATGGRTERIEHEDGRIDMRHLDETGTLVAQITEDLSGGGPWSLRTRIFDPEGTLRATEYERSDGTRQSAHHDAQGTLRETTDVDLEGGQRWESRVARFDADGRLATREIRWDTGSLDTQGFEAGRMVRRTIEDAGETAAWQSYVRAFDETGTLRRADWQMDDGSARTHLHDTDGRLVSERRVDHDDAAPYREKITTYAETGASTIRTWLDSDEIRTVQHDPQGRLLTRQLVPAEDIADWPVQAFAHDPDGVPVRTAPPADAFAGARHALSPETGEMPEPHADGAEASLIAVYADGLSIA